jgi:streptogramin lyase
MSQRLRFLAILGTLACAFGGAARGQVFDEFSIPTAASGALGITVGPDGNLWFTEQTASKIGVIRLGGRITEISLPAGTGPTRIHAGPDGNLWFSESARAFFGRVNVNTGSLTEFPLATSTNATRGVTSGPDGNVWFTENPGNFVFHTATAGAGAAFPIPTASSGPAGITAGPDGNLWFTEFSGNKIGRVTTGGVISEFPIPTANAGAFGITSGPGGYLWFMERTAAKIGRITTAGVITEFPIPSGGEGIAGGADGNIWFVEDSGEIGRLTPAGVVTEFAIPSGAGSAPTGIVAGGDGNLWFVESGANKIGRITTGGLFAALPVVISAPGALGSFFKTSVQIHNPTDSVLSGRFIAHPGGVSGSSADPGGNFSFFPRQTFSQDDTLASNGLSGVYTFDVFITTGPLFAGVFRVFNDAGAAGTTGFNEELVLPIDALTTGQHAVLIAPIDSAKFRFNIGVRTFTLGASITVTVRDINGAVTRVVTKSYPAIFFQQGSAADFLGAPLDTNSSIEIAVDAGSLIVYGATADNITQDPSLQLAKRVS